MKTGLSRRNLLLYCSSLALSPITSAFSSSALADLTTAQRDWRFCGNCNALFQRGDGRGRCPSADQIHRAQGFNFVVEFAGRCIDDTPRRQSNWRKCSKCLVMFFGPATRDSLCAADGGQHVAARDRCFNLPINRLHAEALNPENNFAQGGWRFCGRCTTMFFDGFLDNKGVCPRGGAHAALGDLFVLAHN